MDSKVLFNGFSSSTIQFLKDLESNNYKEWFEDHRNIYEKELLNPFKELITVLTPAMFNIDSQFELRPHRVLSRIYRDTRFSKNKDPYKTSMWMNFQKSTTHWEDFPGFFMELNADNYFYGMGLFAPKKKTMDTIRDHITYDEDEFKKKTQELLKNGFLIGGETYKRTITNNLSEYFQQWIQRKSLYVYKTHPIGPEVFSQKFADIIRSENESLAWLYNFLKDED